MQYDLLLLSTQATMIYMLKDERALQVRCTNAKHDTLYQVLNEFSERIVTDPSLCGFALFARHF
jgi:hypothetical protein